MLKSMILITISVMILATMIVCVVEVAEFINKLMK